MLPQDLEQTRIPQIELWRWEHTWNTPAQLKWYLRVRTNPITIFGFPTSTLEAPTSSIATSWTCRQNYNQNKVLWTAHEKQVSKIVTAFRPQVTDRLFRWEGVFNANIFPLFIINSFSAVKGNLICLNCHWVNINPLHALIKFQKDLTRYKISHIWLDLVTGKKINNKKHLSGLIPGCLWHRHGDNILAFCTTKFGTFTPTEVAEESLFIRTAWFQN